MMLCRACGRNLPSFEFCRSTELISELLTRCRECREAGREPPVRPLHEVFELIERLYTPAPSLPSDVDHATASSPPSAAPRHLSNAQCGVVARVAVALQNPRPGGDPGDLDVSEAAGPGRDGPLQPGGRGPDAGLALPTPLGGREAAVADRQGRPDRHRDAPAGRCVRSPAPRCRRKNHAGPPASPAPSPTGGSQVRKSLNG
jgi:hypothetical protein